jgi:hypothetical protein
MLRGVYLEKRCLLESALEPAAVLAVAHVPTQPAPTTPPAAAAATNNVPIIATADVPTPIQAQLHPNTSIQAQLPPTNTPTQAELSPPI